MNKLYRADKQLTLQMFAEMLETAFAETLK